MSSWEEYKKIAKSRGVLAIELFVAESTVIKSPEQVAALLPQHLGYQKQLEAEGKLFLAGPMSSDNGELMQGTSMVIYRVANIKEASKLADADPMHANGVKTYKLRKWLVNEGALSFSLQLSDQTMTLR